jgi:hypothetical protein
MLKMRRKYCCRRNDIGKDTTQIKNGFMTGRPEIFNKNTLLRFYFCSIILKLVVHQVAFNL